MRDRKKHAVFTQSNLHIQMEPPMPDAARRQLVLATIATAAAILVPRVASAQSLSELSDKDLGAGLRGALERGAEIAVSLLGKKDGFWADERVRIPLPDWIKKVERAIKLLGKSKDIEDMKVAVNRAAEQAVPQAKALLMTAVRTMSVEDARQILTGGDNSVTQFFQSRTRDSLTQRFLPVVSNVTSRIGLAGQYNQLAAQVQQTGLIKLSPVQARVENHVTSKALDGLYFMIAEEERKIRRDPVGTGSEILKRVFGSIK